MAAKAKRSRRAIEPDFTLVASIESSDFSYYIGGHRPEYNFIDDEAIIDLHATILDNTFNPKFVGQPLDCSLVCSRRFRAEDKSNAAGMPALFSITFRTEGASMLAYLPADAFWAIQARLGVGQLKGIEVRYLKPFKGAGDVQSVYLL